MEAKLESGAPKNLGPPLSPGTLVKKTVRTVAAEVQDRETRSRNIILYNMKETGAKVHEEARKEDRASVMSLLVDTLGVDLGRTAVRDIRRLGKDMKEGRDRPLLITLDSGSTKDAVTKNLYKLKNSIYNHISCRNDLTVLEREAERKLVEEARALEENDKSGNFLYRVWGPHGNRQIRQIPKAQQTVTGDQKKI